MSRLPCGFLHRIRLVSGSAGSGWRQLSLSVRKPLLGLNQGRRGLDGLLQRLTHLLLSLSQLLFLLNGLRLRGRLVGAVFPPRPASGAPRPPPGAGPLILR